MEVSVRELKNHLSEYLRRVQDGQEVTVTSRGSPVARLVQVTAGADSEEEAVARLRSLPWVRPGKGGKVKGSADPIPWKPGDPLLSDVIAEDRD